MTGTAKTEATEFEQIYKLDVVEIPTNKPMVRDDLPDSVYKTEAGKFRAVIEQIRECHDRHQPVLVGTISIEKSELLSKLLKKEGIPHNVLNAKHHEKEAEIVAQAGKKDAVTIATNMAGRGTDIMLGGNPEYLAKAEMRRMGVPEELIVESTAYGETDNQEILDARATFQQLNEKYKEQIKPEAEEVKQAGGLFILGTERHESRRIDNQLRGRAGRQGDPGESRFYIAMTDDIMRLFGSERVMGMMETLGMDEDTPLDQKMLSGAIEQAQKTVESRNFQTRKNVLEYDDVMNVQRNVIYDERRKVLDGEDLQSSIRKMIEEFVSSTVADGLGAEKSPDLTAVNEALAPFGKLFLRPGDIRLAPEELSGLTAQKLADMVLEKALAFYDAKEKELGLMPNGQPVMRELERVVMLRVVDEYWMEHLDAMTDLRQGIGLRGYGNTKPIDAYKNEGFEMFEAMIRGIREETVRRLFVVRIRKEEKLERKSVSRNAAANVGGDASVKKQPVKKIKKPGRNDPCPCGKLRPNGLPMKYKDCCGRNE